MDLPIFSAENAVISVVRRIRLKSLSLFFFIGLPCLGGFHFDHRVSFLHFSWVGWVGQLGFLPLMVGSVIVSLLPS